MNQETRHKTELANEIEQAWTNLSTVLGLLTPAQMTEARDAAGWNVKDHLVHLMVWERSVVALLQGQSQHQGLGVDEQQFPLDDAEAINAAVQRQRKDMPLDAVLNELRGVHQQFLMLFEPLSDADLARSVGAGGTLMEKIKGNTSEHFPEHQRYIEQLVAATGST